MKKSRPKTLPSTKRERKRYIVYELVTDSEISINEISNAVWFSCLNYLGELGTGKASIWVGKDLYDPKKKKGMVKCSHKHVNEVKAAMTLITRIGDNPVIFNIIGVTGTVDSAEKKYM